MRRRTPRSVALEALVRVEGGAYANLLLPALLERSGLDRRDRGFVTELVYGTTRMRRACDWVIDRHLRRPVEPRARQLLRLGAYQLVFARVPAHAAVSATVAEAPPATRGLANAVLRKVSRIERVRWPDTATELSYPDWVVERLARDLGRDAAVNALASMNSAARTSVRDDGYVQDAASQSVASMVGAAGSDIVVDLCAAPGGKTTAMARGRDGSSPRAVLGIDARPARVGLLRSNAAKLGGSNIFALVADSRCPPLRAGRADRVLVDAPCSGLGTLRRRPDARWRVGEADVESLARLQRQLLSAAYRVVRPGGTLVYSVCTMTAEETRSVDEWLQAAHPDLVADEPAGPPWRKCGRGSLLLPQDAGTDGMYVLRLRRRPG